ncbi:hypothetical protein Tco_0936615 [Tanacetum coccineum]|uniref:Reverse transcriptase domain-containing protein n=1 Tax=Tanacetum coccineum TaxID=301880 RepID=A0ABQ5DBX4_9ASTR
MHHLVLNTITHLLPVPLRIFRQFIPLVYLGAPRSGSFGILRQRSITHMCYPPRRAPRRSEAFRHWCAAPLSTVYPSTTSESSSGDSSERPIHSSPHSAGPSRKRCRSSVDSVSLSMPVTGSLSVYLCYHLPPRRGIHGAMTRGSMRCDASTGGTAEAGIDPMTTPLVEEEIVEPAGEDSPDSPDIRDGIVRSVEDMPIDLSDDVRDFYRHMSEVRVDRIVGIETAQGRLETDQLIASGDRARMAEAIYSLRMRNPINGNNRGDNGDGNENPNVNGRGGRLVARECTYQDFMKCQPTSFKGTEGVVGLIRWSEKMETVFHISNCSRNIQ